MSQKKIPIAPIPDNHSQCRWTEDALELVRERFLMRDKNGVVVETVKEMCWRTAYYVASADTKYGRTETEATALAVKFHNSMAERKFFPNAPTLYNAGTGNNLQFSACFVLPIEDSMEGIFDALKWQALIHKSGGGTGFSFSRLRQKNAMVGSTRGVSSGPISFLKIYNSATDSVKQGGKRRGANMAIMSAHHPDILEFVQSKGVLDDKNQKLFDLVKRCIFSKTMLESFRKELLTNQISNFNISVAATDVFMGAVKNNSEYNLVDPRDNQVVGRLKAREVFDLIVKMAWETGDPGLWFVDKTNKSPANPLQGITNIDATNPCGEQPLFSFDVCNLGSIALVRFLSKENSKYVIDWDELEKTIRLSVHFLDNVIDVNPYPLPQIMKLAHDLRRIGLGVMGWADLLVYLNIPYASDEACKLAEVVQSFINKVGHDESEKLAQERGPFPLWDKSIYKDGKPIRNCTVTTIAPTGEISVLAGCSGGIEPNYGLTSQHTSGDRVLTRIFPSFYRLIEIAKERNFYSPALEEEVKNRGNIIGLKNIPGDIKKIFVTAHEIEPEWHVKMQLAFQKYTDNGVSKTINLPNSAGLEDIEKAYWQAYEAGCLGITVFRDGCKGSTQVLSVGTSQKTEEKIFKDFVKSRPDFVMGATIRIKTSFGAAFVTINFDSEIGPSEPFEIFLSIGKAGSDILADAEAIGRALSMILRMESPMPPIERLKQMGRKQFDGIGGSQFLGFRKEKVMSLADGIAKAIEIYLEHFNLIDESETDNKTIALNSGNICPQCHNNSLIYGEGCVRCSNCDYDVC